MRPKMRGEPSVSWSWRKIQVTRLQQASDSTFCRKRETKFFLSERKEEQKDVGRGTADG